MSSNLHLLLAQQDKGEHEVFAISDGVVACPKPAYRSYPERWWLLLTVVLLNLANYSHWVAFPSVTKESYPQVQSLRPCNLGLEFLAFKNWVEPPFSPSVDQFGNILGGIST